jgi:hypothetical protein
MLGVRPPRDAVVSVARAPAPEPLSRALHVAGDRRALTALDLETKGIWTVETRGELLSRGFDGAWSARTIFANREEGHWLCAGECDARKATDELVGCGYGGRVFVLARPPGFGRPEAALPQP